MPADRRHSRRIRRGRTTTRKVRRGHTARTFRRGDVTIGILSWDAYKTLENTLSSYKKNNLFKYVTPFLYFQELSERDKEMAKKYKIPFIGSKENTGVKGAFQEMVRHTKSKYFIFAEQDFELVQGPETIQKVLEDCIRLVEEDGVDYIRLRDKENPGKPLFSKSATARLKAKYKLENIHWVPDLMKKYPGALTHKFYNYDWYMCGEEDNFWSNNIFFAKTRWLREKVLGVLEKDKAKDKMMEQTLMHKLKDYTLATGPGLFSHKRLDRGE